MFITSEIKHQLDQMSRGYLSREETVWYCGRNNSTKRTTSPEYNRFVTRIEFTDNFDDCWFWKGSNDDKGYGRLTIYKIRKSSLAAHRLAYAEWIGDLPEFEYGGLQINHTCNNGHLGCVNPMHLYLGTHQDNIDDRGNAGRTNRPQGVLNKEAKLTEDDVKEIRRLYATGKYFQKTLANMFGITQTQV